MRFGMPLVVMCAQRCRLEINCADIILHHCTRSIAAVCNRSAHGVLVANAAAAAKEWIALSVSEQYVDITSLLWLAVIRQHLLAELHKRLDCIFACQSLIWRFAIMPHLCAIYGGACVLYHPLHDRPLIIYGLSQPRLQA